MYLQFMAGRGWNALQDEERAHRTGEPIPLLAWSEERQQADEQAYTEINDEVISDLFARMAGSKRFHKIMTLREYFNSRLEEASDGSAAGKYIALQHLKYDEEYAKNDEEYLLHTGMPRDKVQFLVRRMRRCNGHGWQWCLTKGFKEKLQEVVLECRRRGGTMSQRLFSYARRALVCRVGGDGMLIGGDTVGSYKIKRSSLESILNMVARAKRPGERRRRQVEQPLKDLVTALNWEHHVRERHKARRLHLNKRLWLEMVKWQDVEAVLTSPPKLKGFGFQKNEIAVRRQLLASDPEHNFISRYVLRQFDTNYRVHPWADLGFNACEELSRKCARSLVVGRNAMTGICIGADFKDFNACHRLRDMSNDYRLMRLTFERMLYEKGREKAAVDDWMRCCRWLEQAAVNCWMELEDQHGEERVTVGLFSGIQDTNGTNERRHIVEVSRAFEELARCGLMPREKKARVHIELRGDDSIIITSGAVDSALLFTALCASGRLIEGIKQEIWSTQCEYLRNKVTKYGCQGYVNRNIGTLISAPFENANRHDVVGRLEAICQQVATIHRRGASTRNCELLLRVLTEYWGSYKQFPEAGCDLSRIRQLPVEALYGCKTDGRLDCNLLPERQRHLRHKFDPAPRFTNSGAPTRITRDIPARGAADLSSRLVGRVNEVLECQELRNLLAAEIHAQITAGSALPSEMSAAYRDYEARFAEWADTLIPCEEPREAELWFVDANGEWHPDERQEMHSFWLTPEKAWQAYYRDKDRLGPNHGWVMRGSNVYVTFNKTIWLEQLVNGRGNTKQVFGIINPDHYDLEVRTTNGWHHYVLYKGQTLGPIRISNQMNAIDVIGSARLTIQPKGGKVKDLIAWADFIHNQVVTCIRVPEAAQSLMN
uniref:RNA-directed RNA polymerase n=1 Tax=Haemonchus contortus TaxID=6289 RepID=A0A7I5E900_HAECO